MKVKLVILLLCLFTKGYSQGSEDEYKILIDSSISLKIDELIEFSKKKNGSKAAIENIYLLDKQDLPYLYSSRSDIQFKQIDIYKSENKRTLKKGITALKILTKLKKDTLAITIQCRLIKDS